MEHGIGLAIFVAWTSCYWERLSLFCARRTLSGLNWVVAQTLVPGWRPPETQAYFVYFVNYWAKTVQME